MTAPATTSATYAVGALLLLALSPAAAFCACSGGGSPPSGSSTGYPVQPSTVPEWTSDQNAGDKAAENGTGILYALESAVRPIGIWDDRLQALSKSTPFVLVSASSAETFLCHSGIDVQPPALAVADAYGNILWSSNASISVNTVLAALQAAPEAARQNARHALQEVAAAKADQEHGRMAQALQRLSAVMALHGYPAVAAATALHAAILAQGHAAVAGCLQLAASDRTTARSRFKALARLYAGTPVDAEVGNAIKSLQ